MKDKNLYWKLAEIRDKLSLKKTGQNNFGGYSYYELDEICNKTKKIFAEYGIFTYSQMIALKDVSGDIVGFELTLHVVNADNPEETIEVKVASEKAKMKGAQAPQECGAVRTYLYKYCLLDLIFADDGADDPDKNNTHGKKTKISKSSGGKGKDRNGMVEEISNLPEADQLKLKKKYGLKDSHVWKFTKADILSEVYKEVSSG